MAVKKTAKKKTAKKSVKKRVKVDKAEAAARVKEIWPVLKKRYPDATIALHFGEPFELVVATILSAQCTDERVNIVTQDLFKKYRKLDDWINVEGSELENDIRSTGFFRNKAKNIKGAAEVVRDKFGGVVPDTMEELLVLPGVGRKTANVILGHVFGKPGITCDTHVIRLSRRLGLSSHSDPTKLEFDLNEIVPEERWTVFSDLLIWHGRNICKARKPECPNCPIAFNCPSANRPELW